MNRQRQRQHSRMWRWRNMMRCQFTFVFQLSNAMWLLLPLLQLLLSMPMTFGGSDWMQDCGSCHCNWNSGKKTADCKNKGFTTIPDNLGNELQVIEFNNNQIPELRRDEFVEANLNNLHKIYLKNCTIQELNRDSLRGLTILIELDLSHNNIRDLHPNTFHGLVKLRNLVLNNNEIEVLHNYLFVDLPFLSRVEFKNNRLKQVEMYAFGQLPLLTSVYLEANSLTVLRKETFANTPKLIHLSLAQNPWNCTCELQEFRDFAISNRLYTPPTDCAEPPQLRGKLWSDIQPENFACKPRILGLVRQFIEAQSDNITIPCRIEGTPRPNVTWVYNKRPISATDYRFSIMNSIDSNSIDVEKMMTSELRIYGVRSTDKGIYTCIADNRGGRAEAEFQLLISGDRTGPLDGLNGGAVGATTTDTQSNILLIICLIAMTFLLLLIIMVLVICWYCRRIKTYQKDNTMMSENGLISSKLEKTHNASMLEGGSVIMEMQKSLLTEVNPVEKPPRRTELECVDGGEESLDIKKTLLDETPFGHHTRDDETHSIALSDTTTTPRSRHTYVDDNYGSSLPPDLLAFPARVPPTPPSMQSSQSNIPEQIIYGIRSPQLTSPVYAHMTPHGIYGTTIAAPHHHHNAATNGFLTLQHPKSRNLALIAAANNRQQQQQHQHQQQQHLQQQHHQLQLQQQQQLQHQQHQLQQLQQQQQQHLQQQQQQQQQSPFVPAPVVYAPTAAAVVMKQGYMTIPRKPRVPSWAPSTTSVPAAGITAVNAAAAAAAVMHNSSQLSEFQSPTSPNPSETGTATTAELQAEPVYDNLGLRTTAGGNSTLNLHKPNALNGSIGGSSGGGGGGGGGAGGSGEIRYTMRDRPLPATPSLSSVASNATMQSNSTVAAQTAQAQTQTPLKQQQQQQQQHQQQLQASASKIYEPIHELTAAVAAAAAATPQSLSQQQQPHLTTTTTTCDTEPLYGTARHHSGLTLVPSAMTASTNSPTPTPTPAQTLSGGGGGGVGLGVGEPTKTAKIPPRPPPKPKKKLAVTTTRSGAGSTSQLFDDEGEDGTEV